MNAIARDNDAFRRGGLFHATSAGQWVLTQGAQLPSPADLAKLLQLVRDYDKWGKGNDPYGEHDFGAVEFRGERFFWKIDYYADSGMMYGGDPREGPVFRVLTVMRADEY